MLVRSSALHNAHPTPGWIRVGGSGCCGAGLCERCGDTAGTAPGSCTALGPSQPPPVPPALSLPCGADEQGLPIGAQLVGPALGDAAVLNAAHAYQLDTDWHTRTPSRKGGDGK